MPSAQTPSSNILMDLDQIAGLKKEIETLEVKKVELEGVKDFVSIEASVKVLKEEKQKLSNSVSSFKAKLAKLEKKEFELPAADARRIEEIEQTAKDLLETFRQKSLTIRDEAREEASKIISVAKIKSGKILEDSNEKSAALKIDATNRKRLITKRQKELTACELELNRTEARLVALKRDIGRREKKLFTSQDELMQSEAALSLDTDKIDKAVLKFTSDRVEFEKEKQETLKRLSNDREILNYKFAAIKKHGNKVIALQKEADNIDLNISELNIRSGELDAKEIELNALEKALNARVEDTKKQESDLATNWLVYKKEKKRLDIMLKKLEG